LILRRIVKIFVTKCQILRLKRTKIDLQRFPRPLAALKGVYFLKNGKGGGEGLKGRGGNEERGRKGRGVWDGRGPRVYL